MTEGGTERIVLVVEDEDFLRDGIARLFEASGWKVLEARDGLEAIEIFRAEPVEVVLTDLLMPRLDGIRLLHEIRALDPEVPAVVLTGFGTLERCAAALRAGACDFLTKPFENQELVETLERAWRSRHRPAAPESVLAKTEWRLRVTIVPTLEAAASVVGEVETLSRAAGFYRSRWAIRRGLEEALAIHAAVAKAEEIRLEAYFDGEKGVVRIGTAPGARSALLRGPASPSPRGGVAKEDRGAFLVRSFADEVREGPDGWIEMIFWRRRATPTV